MKRLIRGLLFCLPCLAALANAGRATERLALDGEWRFALGEPQPSFPQGALPAVAFTDTIALPGTTETRGKGPENPARETMTLTRARKFDGAAWYQRDLVIPAAWGGQHIELRLERTKYTQLWLDEKPVGEKGLYTVGQCYDLTGVAAAGPHRLTLMVDNRPERRPVITDAHQFSDNTHRGMITAPFPLHSCLAETTTIWTSPRGHQNKTPQNFIHYKKFFWTRIPFHI